MTCRSRRSWTNQDKIWPILKEDGSTDDIEGVPSFTYLGVPTSFKGQISLTFSSQAERAVSKARSYLGAITKIGTESVDRRELIKVCWENVAVPSILYGCETSIFTKKALLELEKIQCKVAKLCIGARKDTSGFGARLETGLVRMETRIKQQQLLFLNHVLSKSSDSLAYNAWKENNCGNWMSPYKQLWMNLKYETDTWGISSKTKIKESCAVLENNYILRELPKHESLKYLPINSLCRSTFRPKSSVEQSIISSFRVGDTRIGFKELMQGEIMPSCPMCTARTLSLSHFMLWCPALDDIRRECGIYCYMVEKHFFEGNSETKTVQLYLDAEGNKPETVKVRGKALVMMRNNWYRIAKRKNIELNVRTKDIILTN